MYARRVLALGPSGATSDAALQELHCSGGMHQLLYQIRLVKAAVLNVREKRPSAQFWLLESRRPRCPKRSRVLGAAMSHGKATCDLRTGGWGLRDQIRPRESRTCEGVPRTAIQIAGWLFDKSGRRQ